jgi:hypothetical protein
MVEKKGGRRAARAGEEEKRMIETDAALLI